MSCHLIYVLNMFHVLYQHKHSLRLSADNFLENSIEFFDHCGMFMYVLETN